MDSQKNILGVYRLIFRNQHCILMNTNHSTCKKNDMNKKVKKNVNVIRLSLTPFYTLVLVDLATEVIVFRATSTYTMHQCLNGAAWSILV